MNPYYDNNFFQFFVTLGSRLIDLLSGKEISMSSDELQLLTIMLIAISASGIGVFLVLRRMTMLTNAISHTILAGVVLAYFAHRWLGIMDEPFDFSHLLPSETVLLVAALIMAFLTVFLTELLITQLKLREDISCGIVFTFLFSLGVIALTVLSRNAHIGPELLMGNADALHVDDLILQCRVTLFNLFVLFFLFRGFSFTTFDPIYSKVLGLSPALLGYLLMAQVAVTSIASFRAVGVLLVLGFFVGPPLIARQCTHRLVPLFFVALLVAIITSCVGVALSRHLVSVFSLPISTSALVVCVIALTYVVVLLAPRRA